MSADAAPALLLIIQCELYFWGRAHGVSGELEEVLKAASAALWQVNSCGFPLTMTLNVDGYRREYFKCNSRRLRLTGSKERRFFIRSALKSGYMYTPWDTSSPFSLARRRIFTLSWKLRSLIRMGLGPALSLWRNVGVWWARSVTRGKEELRN